MKPLILIGGGGHARSLLAMLEGSVEIAGYVDVAPCTGLPLSYLGTDDDLRALYSPADYAVHVAIGFNDRCRTTLRQRLRAGVADFDQPALAAPSAWVASEVEIGSGSAIMARAVVNRSRIGCGVVVNTGAIVEHDCVIADDAFIGPGAIICGGAIIGPGAFIGAGAVVMQGVEIPASTVVGMGSVILASTISGPGTYVGNPARKLKE